MKASLLDRGYLALGVVIGFSVTLVSVLLVEHLHIISSNETIVGAIVGGVLSGLVTLFAVTIGTYFDNNRAEQERYLSLEAEAFSAYSKVTDILDDITKQYRHHFDSTSSLRLHYSKGSEKKSLAKPLQGKSEKIRFTTDEKSVGLKLKSIVIFNDLNNLDAISETFHFLREEYGRRYFDFQKSTFETGKLEIEGRNVSSDAKVHPLDLIGLEDASEQFKSFLFKTQHEVREAHRRYTEALETHFGKRFEFEILDSPSQSKNMY